MSHALKAENLIPPVLLFLKTLEILILVLVKNVIAILTGACAESVNCLWNYSIHLPVQEMQVQSLGREDLLEKEIATHSSIFA